MKYGNWVPISKGFIKSLPKDRSYTELEAAYCLQLDYDNKNKATITGYANLWRWSVGKVYRFFERMNIKIKYPETTKKKQNQNGMIVDMITEGSRNDNGMIRLIKNSNLQNKTEGKRNESGMITEGSQVTTIEPKNLKPDKDLKNILSEKEIEEKFKIFWEVWNDKTGRTGALKSFQKIKLTDELFDKIIIGAKTYADNRPTLISKKLTPKMAQGWLTDKRWEDDVQTKSKPDPFKNCI